jgi:hypothetical protein
MDDAPHALALNAALGFLDAVHDSDPRAAALLDRLCRRSRPAGGCTSAAERRTR